MSLVLSIYSEKAFREVSLPEKSSDKVEILIRKDLFILDTDIVLSLEYSGEQWILSAENSNILERTPSGQKQCGKAVALRENMNLSILTAAAASR